jgi:hypothetical protein
LPPIKTTIVLIWAYTRILAVGFQKYGHTRCIAPVLL